MKFKVLHTSRIVAVGCGALILATGCSKKADNTINYTSAINSYYSAHPACLFSEPKQFPNQVTTSRHHQDGADGRAGRPGTAGANDGGEEGLHRRFEAGDELRSVEPGAVGLDCGYHAAGLRQLLLRASQGEQHRQFDARRPPTRVRRRRSAITTASPTLPRGRPRPRPRTPSRAWRTISLVRRRQAPH